MTTPTEHDHRAAIAANLDRIELPTYADAVRALPVLRTCGPCRHWRKVYDSEAVRCEAVSPHMLIDVIDAPPSWCPLRGGER